MTKSKNLPKRAFYYHYNKPLTAKTGSPVISVHFEGTCHFVKNVHLRNVNTDGRIRKSQPRWVIAGKAQKIEIINEEAWISNENN